MISIKSIDNDGRPVCCCEVFLIDEEAPVRSLGKTAADGILSFESPISCHRNVTAVRVVPSTLGLKEKISPLQCNEKEIIQLDRRKIQQTELNDAFAKVLQAEEKKSPALPKLYEQLMISSSEINSELSRAASLHVGSSLRQQRFFAAENRSVSLAARISTVNNPPFNAKRLQRNDFADSQESAPTELSSPKMKIMAVRYPGPRFDDQGMLLDPATKFQWFLRGRIEIDLYPELSTFIEWSDQQFSDSLYLDHKELNCRIKLDFSLAENPYSRKAKCKGENSASDDCLLLLIRLEFTTLDGAALKSCRLGGL